MASNHSLCRPDLGSLLLISCRDISRAILIPDGIETVKFHEDNTSVGILVVLCDNDEVKHEGNNMMDIDD